MTGNHAHIHVSTKPVWGPVIELVDLGYRPDVNTRIEALAESDPSEHGPLAEPIWTTTPEEYGLGVGGKSKCSQVVKSSSGATHSRSEHPDPYLFLPPSLRGLWRGLSRVGR